MCHVITTVGEPRLAKKAEVAAAAAVVRVHTKLKITTAGRADQQAVAGRAVHLHRIACITLHYIASHYIALHALHCITLHYVTLRYVTLHYVTLRYITLRYMTYHMKLHYRLLAERT